MANISRCKMFVGGRSVLAVYLGEKNILERYVRVSPETIWLVDENDVKFAEIYSNSSWIVY